MKQKPFHYWMPNWVLSSVDNKNCTECFYNFKKDNIISIGIRKHKGNRNMFIEHKCSNCGKKSIILVGGNDENSIENMCYVLLDSIKTKKITEKSSGLTKKLKGSLTKQEANKMIDFIRKSKTHNDLLREMGIHLDDKHKDD